MGLTSLPYLTLKGLPLHFFLAGTGAGLLAIHILLRRMFALDLCLQPFPLGCKPVIPTLCFCLRFPASPA